MHPSIGRPSPRVCVQLSVALLLSLAAGLGIYAARADRADRPAPQASRGVSAWHLGSVRAVSAQGAGRVDGDDGSPGSGISRSPDQDDGASFSIRGQVAGPLYPGGASEPIALTIFNPNSFPIQVTALQAILGGGSVGCPAAGNITITQSGATVSSPLRVPANASVTLPAQGISAPAIQMVDRPVNQDACQSAAFTLSYTGSARS